MKFRRRARTDAADPEDVVDDVEAGTGGAGGESVEGDDDYDGPAEQFTGPYDVDELPEDGVGRIDLGSLLIPAVDGLELRLQVDEASGVVQSVMLAGEEGAIELRAFAAPRNGDLWSEVVPQLAADMAQRGGTATQREGRFGTELVCQMTVQTPDGQTANQPSRIIGHNGSRWLLRATLLGRPAVEIETSGGWEDAIAAVAVRRGAHALPVGEPLPIDLPDDVQRIDDPA